MRYDKLQDRSGLIRLLLIGPLPPPIGGATQLFSYLVEDLSGNSSIELEVIDISRPLGHLELYSNLRKGAEVLWRTVRIGRHVDVISFHANERGRILFGPIIYLLARLLGKPIVMRAFGGAFHRTFRRLPSFYRCVLLRTYLRADRCLFETRQQVLYFSSACGSRAVWFPNCTRFEARCQLEDPVVSRRICRRFVYIGRVVPEKGVDSLFEIEPELPDGVSIDIYGPVGNGCSMVELCRRGNGQVRYRGVLDHHSVMECLQDHDALVLPTRCVTEGYPGVVLEAFASGRPVIVSDLQSLREIVDDSCGILVEMGNSQSLLDAIRRIERDDALYESLCRGALAKGMQFSASLRTKQFVQVCRDVVASCLPDG